MSAAERRRAEREVKGLRDRLVVNYSPLVPYVAGRVLGRVTSAPVDREDVLSWGIIGLLDPIETYDPERRTKFESYAISKIRWSILDELRRTDPLSRRLRRRVREVEAARGELAQSLGRAPTEGGVGTKAGRRDRRAPGVPEALLASPGWFARGPTRKRRQPAWAPG